LIIRSQDVRPLQVVVGVDMRGLLVLVFIFFGLCLARRSGYILRTAGCREEKCEEAKNSERRTPVTQ
jgi:hypothetical protein